MCFLFQTCRNDTIGRFLESTRFIPRGEVIIKEKPLISGPTALTPPVCVGCHRSLTQQSSRPCSKCGWPVCSAICERNPNHIPECSFTSGDRKVSIRHFDLVHPVYRCVTTLRCLYHKKYGTKTWKKLATLESHDDERKKTRTYEEERVFVAEFIRRFFRLDFDPEEILNICGIVQINGHEVPLVEPPYVAIFATASLLQHSCTANCAKSFDANGRLVIAAARDISPGESLTICYADALWGTAQRRHFLKQTKFFDCACPRCLDPTEFNTHFGCVKCPACKSDMTARNVTEWVCDTCLKVTPLSYVNDVLERFGRDLEDIPKDKTDTLRDYIDKSGEYLHRNHFYVTEAKMAVAHNMADVRRLTDEELDVKLAYCRDLVPLIETIAYGEVRALGSLLFEMHAGLAEKSRRLGGDNTHLMESRKCLEEVVRLLKNEPAVMPEGDVYKQAVKNLAYLDEMLLVG